MTDLNSLARTLAERLRAKWDGKTMPTRPAEVTDDIEAVIREAIDKTLEEAARLMDERAADPYSDSHLACTSGAEIIRERARSLKQSNSGMEVRK